MRPKDTNSARGILQTKQRQPATTQDRIGAMLAPYTLEMTTCSHTWVPETYYRDRCVRCDELRQRPLRYAHQQSGEVVETLPSTIQTHDIHGEPVEWTPIQGDETHD